MNNLPAPYWLLKEEHDQNINFVIVTSSNIIESGLLPTIEQIIKKHCNILASSIVNISESTNEVFLTTSTQNAWKTFKELIQIFQKIESDVAVLPATSRTKKLLICDMDSTIVDSESLDDLASEVGKAAIIKEITRKAMDGEVNFTEAFQQRMNLLKNTKKESIYKVLDEININPGARSLLKVAKLNGIRTILVSGGIEPIVQPIAKELGFDRYVANKVEFIDGTLSNNTFAPIVDGLKKQTVLYDECTQMNILPENVCCLGDGANDLLMIKSAGLGISFKAKKILKSATPYQINTSNIDFTLKIMGIGA